MSEQNGWSEKQEFHGDINEYLRTRVLMLAAVFNRKASDELVAVFQEVLKGYPFPAVKGAFTKAESTLERFPTPKMMRELCNDAMPSNSWRYDFRPATAKDPETGKDVRVFVDPDPSCDACREPRSLHPTKKCLSFKDYANAKLMYRAEDCPEGRAFLAALKGFSKRVGRV